MDLKKGTRIYYHGDVANRSGAGTIAREITDEWGEFVDIDLDDGRDINRLPLTMFSKEYKGHAVTRFVTLEAYNTWRRAQFAHYAERYGWGEYQDRQ